MSDSWTGFGLDIGFIDNFNAQLVFTLNYSAVANNLHTLQLNSVHAVFSSARYLH
jgi:ethanolamine utilization microcompartment shell protein EutS